MGYIIGILLIIIFVLVTVNLKIKFKQESEYSNDTSPIDYKNSYQRKYLLTKNEWHAYKKLQDLAAKRELQVCPKVRMLDLVEPRRGEKHYKTLFWKVQAKHVDFLICDKDLNIKAILELDDNSHNTNERKERDTFVDEVLTSVGYKVIRAKYINEDVLDHL